MHMHMHMYDKNSYCLGTVCKMPISGHKAVQKVLKVEKLLAQSLQVHQYSKVIFC